MAFAFNVASSEPHHDNFINISIKFAIVLGAAVTIQ